MRYVDNLLECKPEEIQHINETTEIVLIIRVLDPFSDWEEVRVVWADGNTCTYNIDGRPATGTEQYFIYRPKKVRRLKPLHVILSEHPYQYDRMRLWIGVRDEKGIINFKDYRPEIIYEDQNNTVEDLRREKYPDSFFEEVTE